MKDSMNQHIAILMATYNGGSFLSEQIDSLLGQSYKDWHLYVHDDGSTDDTVTIVRRYMQEHPDKMTLLDYPSQGGACKNFLSMLGKVDAPYYMFCDQDDVWLPNKIELSIEMMKQLEAEHPDKPIVVHTDLKIVDEHLHGIFDSMYEYTGKYPQYIRTFNDTGGHTSIATGCTMLFNRLAEKGCSPMTEKAIMHDCWLCLCTLKQKGVVYGIQDKTVLYRQHGDNCMGAGKTKAADVNILFRIRHFKKVYEQNRKYYAMLHAIGYGSIFKYLYYKIMYKRRIRRGFY